jgi:hypothetical protein
VCVDNGPGALPSPCLGGVQQTGESSSSVWVSSNPPSYGEGLATPYGPGGSFTVTLQVKAKDAQTDCLTTPRGCAVVTRADHTRTSDRTQDARVPVSFASAAPVAPAVPAPPVAQAPVVPPPATGAPVTRPPGTKAPGTPSTAAPATPASASPSAPVPPAAPLNGFAAPTSDARAAAGGVTDPPAGPSSPSGPAVQELALSPAASSRGDGGGHGTAVAAVVGVLLAVAGGAGGAWWWRRRTGPGGVT